MPTPQRFRGNTPKAGKKAARYRIKRDDGEWVVQLQYVLNNAEHALLTTREHPDLVEMVNRTKEVVSGTPGGTFTINEFGQVLVPSMEAEYFLAGSYDECLEFLFEGEIVSCNPPAGTSPGDAWNGPHVGMPYTLAASGEDIRYKTKFDNVVETRTLSDAVGADAARQLAQRLSIHKRGGGGIYVNECREFFAAVEGEDGWSFKYLGPLAGDAWFAPT